MLSLEGKTVLLTGGTRGIGRVAAMKLAGMGARLAVSGRTVAPGGKLPGSLEETQRDVENLGAEVCVVPADLSKAEDVQRLCATVADRFGGVDIIVNNAGYMGRWSAASIDTLELDGWNFVFAVNVTAPLMIAKYFVGDMRRRGGGRIINVTSSAADFDRDSGSVPGLAYPASKAALNLMSNRLARDLRPDNIAVILMNPGYTASEGVIAARKAFIKPGDEARFSVDNALPPSVPAGVIAHLASCPDPFAFVGPIHDAASVSRSLGLSA
jgi:NAD(P)-dependent dehydrogenase (short-subunit alcohol dehydrogenase family)